MTLAALFATPNPPNRSPQLDVAHEPIFIHGGTQPSAKTTLFIAATPFNPSHAHALGLQWLRLNRSHVDLCWLGDAQDAHLQPLMAMLADEPRIGAVNTRQGTLLRVSALKSTDFQPTQAAFQANGWRWVQAPDTPTPAQISPLLIRPFRRSELSPVPKGWRVGPPDFIGAGCGKAGTSWWYDLLLCHPDIVPNRAQDKELHFLCQFDYRGPSTEQVETYRAAFAAPPGKICGEFSGNILQHPMAIQYMAQAAPDARIITLVRNPIDRSVSAYNQFFASRAPFVVPNPGPRRRMFENFSLFPEAMNASRLARPFTELLHFYPRDQILVLQYESCKADPETALRRTWSFLGLPPAAMPRQMRSRGHRIPYTVPRPDPTQRARMATWFQEDVDAFFGMFPGLDRSLWADFA